jgi:hypothetical protein
MPLHLVECKPCTRFPGLATVAREFLSTPSTSVPSERPFSKAGDVIRKKRSSLKPNKADQENRGLHGPIFSDPARPVFVSSIVGPARPGRSIQGRPGPSPVAISPGPACKFDQCSHQPVVAPYNIENITRIQNCTITEQAVILSANVIKTKNAE